MRYLFQAFCALALIGALGPAANAAHDDIGPMHKAADQTLVCMVYCDSGPCDFEMTIQGPNGETLKDQSFNNVPDNGIRKLVYAGGKSPVSCEIDNDDGSTSEPSWTVLDNRANVVAMGTNDESEDSEDVGPVWNARNQTPICMIHCDSGECDIKLKIYGSEGQVLKQKNFFGVPNNGNRMLPYDGGESMISCEAKRIESDECLGSPREPAWVVLDVDGKVVAYMTNDSNEDFE